MPVLIVALGMVLVILTGQIDISVGSQFADLQRRQRRLRAHGTADARRRAWPACLVGAAMGGINGALVAWVRIPSIVVTLATMVALRDGLRWVTQGAWVQDLPPGFQWFGPIASRQRADHRGQRRRAGRRHELGAAQPGRRPRGVRHRQQSQCGAPGGHQSAPRGIRGLRADRRADRASPPSSTRCAFTRFRATRASGWNSR